VFVVEKISSNAGLLSVKSVIMFIAISRMDWMLGFGIARFVKKDIVDFMSLNWIGLKGKIVYVVLLRRVLDWIEIIC
jgi:hypothetical protein